MKKLLVISNHNPNNWEESQREGWDYIEYHPFPNVPATATKEEVEKIAEELMSNVIDEFLEKEEVGQKSYINLQGEFSLCKIIYQSYIGSNFVFPTTERVVEELIKEDGTIEKISRFKFVQWR